MTTQSIAPWDKDLSEYQRALINTRLRIIAGEEAAVRQTFGETLAALTKLGVSESKARPLLGRWRKTYTDALIAQAVDTAVKNSAADPASFITATLKTLLETKNRTSRNLRAEYEFLGWERPAMTPNGPRFKHERRGQVWRDQYNAICVFPAKDGIHIPSVDQDPGYAPKAA